MEIYLETFSESSCDAASYIPVLTFWEIYFLPSIPFFLLFMFSYESTYNHLGHYFWVK